PAGCKPVGDPRPDPLPPLRKAPSMRVLGIETSCDETGVAVYDTAPGAGLLAHAVYSQIALHAEYGGVVPELASRDHVRKLLPLVRQTLAEAGMGPADLDGVAYTAGPGLSGRCSSVPAPRAPWPGRWRCRRW